MPATMNDVPNQPKTSGRSIRVPDELWHEAMRIAHERGETNSDVVRDALEAYVEKHRKPAKRGRSQK